MKSSYLSILLVLFGCSAAQIAVRTEEKSSEIQLPFTWIDLVGDEIYQCLASQNQQTQIPLEKCTWNIPVRTVPNESARIDGHIRIVAHPSCLLERSWIPIDPSSQRIEFGGDLDTGDWGYGSPFLTTVLEVRGNWIKLPQNPFPSPVWIDITPLTGKPQFTSLQELGVFNLGVKSFVLIDIKDDTLVVREEQPADMWCEDGEPPPLTDAPSWSLSIADVYDENQHLKIKEKYQRGC